MQLTTNDFLKVLNELQVEVNEQTIIFKSDRALKAKSEMLDELRDRLIDAQLRAFEDQITATYNIDPFAFYGALEQAHRFAHEHGLILRGSFARGRFGFAQMQEVVCV